MNRQKMVTLQKDISHRASKSHIPNLKTPVKHASIKFDITDLLPLKNSGVKKKSKLSPKVSLGAWNSLTRNIKMLENQDISWNNTIHNEMFNIKKIILKNMKKKNGKINNKEDKMKRQINLDILNTSKIKSNITKRPKKHARTSDLTPISSQFNYNDMFMSAKNAALLPSFDNAKLKASTKKASKILKQSMTHTKDFYDSSLKSADRPLYNKILSSTLKQGFMVDDKDQIYTKAKVRLLRNSAIESDFDFDVKVKTIQNISEQKQMIKKRRLMNIIQKDIEKEIQSCTVVPRTKRNTTVLSNYEKNFKVLQPVFSSKYESPRKPLFSISPDFDKVLPRTLNKFDKLMLYDSVKT